MKMTLDGQTIEAITKKSRLNWHCTMCVFPEIKQRLIMMFRLEIILIKAKRQIK